MRIIDRIFRKGKRKEKESSVGQSLPEFTHLEKICSDSPEIYNILKSYMFLNPEKINKSVESAVSKAKEYEKAKDLLRAAIWYRIAGGLALYQGDVVKVKEYFRRYSKLIGKDVKIVEFAEEAVKKAKEYYMKYLKNG